MLLSYEDLDVFIGMDTSCLEQMFYRYSELEAYYSRAAKESHDPTISEKLVEIHRWLTWLKNELEDRYSE